MCSAFKTRLRRGCRLRVESSITAIILAGGKSSRMKSQKAFLRLGAKAIIEELLLRLEKKFPRLLIIANEPEKYMKFGIEVVSDILPEKGPLGGIYTGLVKSESLYNFVFACDMPLVNPDLLDYMVDRIEGADIVVPKWQDKFEPLHAIYSKRCIEPIRVQLEKDDLKISNFFSRMNVRIIEQEELERFGHRETSFLNINTPQEYSAVAKTVR